MLFPKSKQRHFATRRAFDAIAKMFFLNGILSMKQISELEKRSRRLLISVPKPAVERGWVRRSKAFPKFTTLCFPQVFFYLNLSIVFQIYSPTGSF